MPLTLLVGSPRVAPGLMTWQAWQAVAAADRVLCSADDLPVVAAVRAAGFTVTAADLDVVTLMNATDEVVWLASDEEADAAPTALADAIVTREDARPDVQVLHASYDVPGARLLDLVAVMDRLRTECPWDQEQTHDSLARYLLEETYEALEAIESGDLDHLREELGDLLLQVMFHARIAAEGADDGFTIDDVAGGIVDKLVYRHPHVFAGLEVADADEVNRNWESLKAAEKKRDSPLDGIPATLPALAFADKVLGRLDRRAGDRSGAAIADAADIGERLLALVRDARLAGVDSEQALRNAVRQLISG